MAEYKPSCPEAAAIHRMLQVPETPKSLFGIDEVSRYVKGKLAVEEDWIAERAGWRLLDAALVEEVDGTPRPLLAARHLLGLYKYPLDSSEPFGWAKKPFKKYATNVGTRTSGYILSLVQRQEIASNEGGYGESRFPLSGNTRRLGEVAEAVWRALSDAIDQLDSSARDELVERTTEAGKPAWYPAVFQVVHAEDAVVVPSSSGGHSDLTFSEIFRFLRGRLVSVVLRIFVRVQSWSDRHPVILFLAAVLAAALLCFGLLALLINGVFVQDKQKRTEQFLSQVQLSPPEVGRTDSWNLGWGPARDVYASYEEGAPRPKFNSTVSPDADQRDFVTIKHDNADNPDQVATANEVSAQPGDTLTVAIFVGNSARTSDDDVDALEIEDARLSVGLAHDGNTYTIYGVLTAANASTVWDGVQVKVPDGSNVSLDTVATRFINSAQPAQGVPIDSSIFSAEGAKLGFWDLDGIVRAGEHFSGYVLVHLRIGE